MAIRLHLLSAIGLISCLLFHWLVVVQGQGRNYQKDRNSTTGDVMRFLRKVADRTTRPRDGTGKAVQVNASVEIQNFRAINEEKMEFSVDLFVRLAWNDPRSAYQSGPPSVILTPEVAIELLWVPDVTFSNAHVTELHGLTADSVLYRVKSNGDVFSQARTHVCFHCDVDLSSFPMDTNQCGMVLESLAYMKNDLDLRWDVTEKAFSFPEKNHPKSFSIKGLEHGDCSEDIAAESEPCLYAQLTMKRLSKRWFLLVYAPSILILLLSSLVFWIPLSARLERTLLIFFLLLTMVPILVGSQFLSPMDGGVKAVDIWVVVCFVFLSFAALEVVVMHLLSPPLDRGRCDSFELMKDDDSSRLAQRTAKEDTVWLIRPNILRRVDVIMRFLYPAVIGLFNAIYWGTYSP